MIILIICVYLLSPALNIFSRNDVYLIKKLKKFLCLIYQGMKISEIKTKETTFQQLHELNYLKVILNQFWCKFCLHIFTCALFVNFVVINITPVIMLWAYTTLFHFFMLKALHIITLALWVGAAILALQLSKVKPSTHITPG